MLKGVKELLNRGSGIYDNRICKGRKYLGDYLYDITNPFLKQP